MKIFLDTSSLIKLYHREEGTEALEQLFSTASITKVFLSEISTIEFASTVWKKVRMQVISPSAANTTLALFESDFQQFTFVPINGFIVEQARNLISLYGKQGLRTLDSIQLSTCLSLKQQVNLFITSDHLLQSFFVAEGLPI